MGQAEQIPVEHQEEILDYQAGLAGIPDCPKSPSWLVNIVLLAKKFPSSLFRPPSSAMDY